MKKQERINQALRLLATQFRIEANTVRLNTHNTLEHELAKAKVAYEWKKDGYMVITEAIFKNGSRADVFIPEKFLVIEVLASESEKEALIKTAKYPDALEIVYLKTTEVL